MKKRRPRKKKTARTPCACGCLEPVVGRRYNHSLCMGCMTGISRVSIFKLESAIEEWGRIQGASR